MSNRSDRDPHHRRREVERVDNGRRIDDRDSRRSDREAPAPKPVRRAELNEFFVDGEGIHREVMQREICKYLGPDALSRPGQYNGTNGYIVKAVRPFTAEMLDDLQRLSEEYMREARDATRRGYDSIPYGSSQAARHFDESAARYPEGPRDPRDPRHIRDYVDHREDSRLRERERENIDRGVRDLRDPRDPRDPRHIAQPPYSSPPSQPGYPVDSYPARNNYPSQQPGYPPQQSYPPGSAYPQGYPPPDRRYPQGSGPGPDSGYGSTPSYASSTSRSSGRGEPDYIYNDPPGDYSPQGHYGQSGYAGAPPPRDPRMAQAYAQYVSVAQDVPMEGVSVNDPYYGGPVSSMAPRAGFPPSRGTPLGGYDPQPPPRDPPVRDGYGRERRR